MRRLTDEEMASLRNLARNGRKGPAKALDALWELILFEAEGISLAEADARPGSFHVQDYAIARDQADELLAAMTERRRLPDRTVAGFHQMWAFYSPADHDDPDVEAGGPQ